jgi:hypothetical protein
MIYFRNHIFEPLRPHRSPTDASAMSKAPVVRLKATRCATTASRRQVASFSISSVYDDFLMVFANFMFWLSF